MVGYVPQHTVLFSMLTVRENIFHAALVNLPHSHFGRRDIAAFVDAILATLSLSRVADNVVGDGVRHIGVSGGESKRCSVGVALAAAPLILILDEPTSGLDSSSALSLVQLLYQLSRSGLTVAAVIHQPRPEVFRLFDHLVLLRPVGHVLYSGPRTGVHHALQAQGLVCGSDSALLAAAQASETAVNMADVLIDVSSRQPSGGAAAAHQHVQKAVNDDGGGGDVPMLLPNNSTLSAVSTTAASAPRPKAANTPMRYPGMLAQTVWCFQRSLLEQYRDYVNLFVEVFIALLAGGLMGASSSADDRIYQGWGGRVKSCGRNIIESACLCGVLFSVSLSLSLSLSAVSLSVPSLPGLLQGPQSLQSPAPQNFAVLQQGFFVGLSISVIASPAAVKVFGTELQQFWREASAGHSRAAYMLGKFLAMLPRLTLSAIHFSSIFYVLVRPRIAYGQFFALVWVYFYCTFAVAAMISILFYKTNTALVAVIITMALTSPNGYQPSLHDLADSGLRNLWGIFYTRWTTGAYAAGEMTHWRNIFDVPLSLSETGFDLTAPIVQVAYAAAIGTFLHLVVFVVLERSFRLYRRPPNAAGRGWLCCRRKHSTMGKYDKLADEAEA